MARLDHSLRDNEDTEFVLRSVIKEIAKSNKPNKYSVGEGNVLVKHKLEFEKSCALIEANYNISVKSLSLYEFAARLESIKDKFKREAENGGSIK